MTIPLEPLAEESPAAALVGKPLVILKEYTHAPIQPVLFPLASTLKKSRSVLLKNSVAGEQVVFPLAMASSAPAPVLITFEESTTWYKVGVPALYPQMYKLPVLFAEP